MEENKETREMLADQYLKEHKIQSLFNKMLASLVFFRPAEPKKFMVEYLQELKNNPKKPVSLFDKGNIESLFHIMDPTRKGFITQKQYVEAMKTLHIQEYPEDPDGYIINQILFPTFQSIVTTALHKEWATFKPKTKEDKNAETSKTE
ncbi:EF-hand calcium-binding domain-containing protein 10 [Octopus bimaculoides]|uniref:EF-hand domain-containing protein n=1 Tax=Octopus bimaculoides TaxID=37653 RepID=A0A0L8GKL4_OCTBM|nr:EF-hand calcium-binding domain-containing protein 10 [Octopus bimaculoides]|eukprot:XP_014780223.1 PREDICTED: EF-hand calcium-binding domain-containing protein 10-like [Octopus bimaculoides]